MNENICQHNSVCGSVGSAYLVRPRYTSLTNPVPLGCSVYGLSDAMRSLHAFFLPLKHVSRNPTIWLIGWAIAWCFLPPSNTFLCTPIRLHQMQTSLTRMTFLRFAWQLSKVGDNCADAIRISKRWSLCHARSWGQSFIDCYCATEQLG